MNICKRLKDNRNILEKKIVASDFEYCPITINDTSALLVFYKNSVNKSNVGTLIVKPLSELKEKATLRDVYNGVLYPEKEIITSFSSVFSKLEDGNAVLLIDGEEKAIAFAVQKYENRSISEPPTSSVIKGPREGFVESIDVNVNLIRRRIKSNDLIFSELTVGKYSKTRVSICFINKIADKNLVKKIKNKIKKIEVDAIIDSSYISKFLSEHKTSLFKQFGNTEKPDILTSRLLEGRIGIIVDGSPIVITLPYLLIEDFQSPSDYYNSFYLASLLRVIRLISVSLSVLLPAFYLSAELFHLEYIPLSFLLTIVSSIKGIPLSPSFELFITLLIFEILNEASVRMPKTVGMVVSIVGGLVLGETAVTAGIISAPALMVIAFSGICLFTVPELTQTFSLIRFIFLIVGGSIGSYGIIVCFGVFIVYIVSFESYGTPIFAPFSPLVKNDIKDSFYKGLMVKNTYRPLSLSPKNKRRISYE